METLTKSIEILEDGKMKATTTKNEIVYLQPPIYVDTLEEIERILLSSSPHKEEEIRVDTSISEIDGVSFSGTFEQLEIYLRDAALKSNDIFSGVGAPIGNWIFVDKKSRLPISVSGDIILPSDTTLVICGTIDLTGDRLVTTGKTTILGGSSETSYLTSTGLAVGKALIKSDWTLAMQFVTLKDIDTAIEIDGSINPPCALDWTGVNFENVPNVGLINTCDNFVYTKGAFLNSKELVFDGNHGTIAFNNSLLQGDGAAGDIVRVVATSTISRRFRIIYSSVIAYGSTNGININNSATVPNESFILDTVNFGGGSSYLPGVTYTDNKALFINCKGISNSGDISQYYMNANATATTVSLVNTPYKAAGTTTSASVTQKFTNTDNRATYVGALTKYFVVTATLSCTSGNNHQIGCYIAKNGSVLPESEIHITTNGSGRAEGAVVQSLVQLTETDYVEVFVENSTSTTDIVVTDLNVIVI